MTREERLEGCLLGTAAGDALGLPREGLSAKRAARMFGPPDRHALFFGRSCLSDDTELTALCLQSLRAEPDDAGRCADAFRRRLRRWVLLVPPGVGLATLRAGWRAWLLPASRCGVASAGNGAAMRAAIFGAWFGPANPATLETFVRANARVTHTDPRAVDAAVRVARLAAGLDAPEPVERPVDPSGFVVPTMAAVEWALASLGDRVANAVALGGDADTVAAIVGGIEGALGRGPSEARLAGIADRPRSVAWLRGLARGTSREPLAAMLLMRNALLVVVVLTHAFRRLLPPY